MSIDKKLQDDLVEYVEVTDEELEESATKAEDEVDGEAAADDVAKTVKKSGKGKASEGKDKGEPAEKLKKVAESADEEDEDDDEEDEDDSEEKFKEDLDALVSSEATLSEGFRNKASLIFEAALKTKLAEQVDRLEASYEEKLTEEVSTMRDEMVEKVDGYLNYVVESWVKENEVAIESGLRTEIAESFIDQLKTVFTEHYIEVPESKIDLVDELAEKVETLEEKYSAAIDKNIELSEEVDGLTRKKVIVEASEGLSVAQAEKLKSLVEDVAFEDGDTYASKVQTIKESYFKKSAIEVTREEELNESSNDQITSPTMQRYLDALKNHNK